MMKDILENQQQHMLISQEERSKDRAAVSLFKEERRERQQLLVLDFKQEERCFFGHDPAKKGKGKGEMNNPTSLRHFC